MSTAAVDVLLPVFNGMATIESAIDSMRRQTLEDIRIVVVDDGSTDATPDLLRAVAAQDARVVVVRQDNAGIVAALNAGLAVCTAPLVARHDADDIAYPERLAVQRAYLDAHPQVVAVGCNAHRIDAGGRRIGTRTTFDGVAGGDPSYAPAKEPYLMHPFVVARREALVDAGGYRYAFHCEDADLYWRLADAGPLVNLPDVLGEYRIHPTSVSGRSILNGRIAAVESQRAAVSAKRRRAGRDDLDFPADALAGFHAAERLDAIVALAADGLTPDERAFLEVATAAKLLELSTYRPYRLTRDDLATMRGYVRRHLRTLSDVNRRQLVFRQILAPSRLRARPLEALRAMPWSLLPAELVRLLRFALRRRSTTLPASNAGATR